MSIINCESSVTQTHILTAIVGQLGHEVSGHALVIRRAIHSSVVENIRGEFVEHCAFAGFIRRVFEIHEAQVILQTHQHHHAHYCVCIFKRAVHNAICNADCVYRTLLLL